MLKLILVDLFLKNLRNHVRINNEKKSLNTLNVFFLNVVHELLNSRGMNPFIATRIEEYLQSINKVTDIHVESKATPLGTSRIGELVNISF